MILSKLADLRKNGSAKIKEAVANLRRAQDKVETAIQQTQISNHDLVHCWVDKVFFFRKN